MMQKLFLPLLCLNPAAVAIRGTLKPVAAIGAQPAFVTTTVASSGREVQPPVSKNNIHALQRARPAGDALAM
jgi:hypothetical protein